MKLEPGMKVSVYWHFPKGCYSVQYKGLVIAHVNNICLKDVKFRVSGAGRQRVLREERKNVHAKIHGIVADITELPEYERVNRVRYNPKFCTTFMSHEQDATSEPILACDFAMLILTYNLDSNPLTLDSKPLILAFRND